MFFRRKKERGFYKTSLALLSLSIFFLAASYNTASLYAAPPSKKSVAVSSQKSKSVPSKGKTSPGKRKTGTSASKGKGSTKSSGKKRTSSSSNKKRSSRKKSTYAKTTNKTKSPVRKSTSSNTKKHSSSNKKHHHIHTSHPKSHYKDSRERAGVTQQKRRGHLIVLDAGHGGYDFGASAFHCHEKQLALKTAFLAKKHLTEKGYKVIMTRTRDIFIPLNKRAAIANQTHGKLFLSFHYNAAKTEKARGIEVFYYQSGQKWRANSSKKLATCVLSKLLNRTGSPSRGVKKGNFHVIRETKMPAILIEGGFVTHKGESTNLKDSKYLDKIALAIAEGVENYFRS